MSRLPGSLVGIGDSQTINQTYHKNTEIPCVSHLEMNLDPKEVRGSLFNKSVLFFFKTETKIQ